MKVSFYRYMLAAFAAASLTAAGARSRKWTSRRVP